jgi:hypothetical protein
LQPDACQEWAKGELPQQEQVQVGAKLCATVLLVAYLTLAFPEW